MTVPLQITFDDEKRTAHEDMLLTVGGYQHRADSYFYVIDRWLTAPATRENALARLLDQWLDDLASLRPGSRVDLPFDLCDQCSAWLRVSRPQVGPVHVELGWTYLEGWTFQPSSYADAARGIGIFEPIDDACFDADLGDLVARVRVIRDELAAASGR